MGGRHEVGDTLGMALRTSLSAYIAWIVKGGVREIFVRFRVG
jgi:hypothetical protein